jgi:hypothetical protein
VTPSPEVLGAVVSSANAEGSVIVPVVVVQGQARITISASGGVVMPAVQVAGLLAGLSQRRSAFPGERQGGDLAQSLRGGFLANSLRSGKLVR